MKRATILLALTLPLLTIALQAHAAPQLALGSVNVAAGESEWLDLSLSEGTENYAGVNAKILLPQGVSVTDVSAGALLSGGNFTLDYRSFSDVGGNGATLIAYSATNTFSGPSGVLLSLRLQVEQGAATGPHPISFATSDPNPLINSKHAVSSQNGAASLTHTTQNGTITILASQEDADGDGVPDATDNCPLVPNTTQSNVDGDSFGDACDPCPLDAGNDADGDTHCASAGDCDDGNPNRHPGAAEVCNSLDDDCDAQTDEGVQTTYYRDNDNDGYGNPANSVQACSALSGYVANNQDCDDAAAAVHPGAQEIWCDGIDQDCNGSDLCAPCQLSVDDARGATGDVILIPVRIETACNDVDAFGFDLDYGDCHVPGYLDFTGNFVRGALTINWDFLDVNELSAGTIRIGGFTTHGIIPEGQSGILLSLEFMVTGCSDGDICGISLGTLANDISGWATVPGTFICGCPHDGDVDDDALITPGDALLVFRNYLGMTPLTECQEQHGDVDDDDWCTPGDALCIFQYYLQLPCTCESLCAAPQ